MDLGFGYRYNNNIFATISYQKAIFDEVNINNIYFGANYQWRNIPLNPYFGVLVGYSQLAWSEYPISTTTSNDETSGTFLLGLQLGMDYDFDNDWSVFMQYQSLKNEHSTYILNELLVMDFQNNLQIGVRYGF